CLSVGLPLFWLPPAPAPLLRHPKERAPRPIEVAFERIRLGMTENELLMLMAPFQKVYTGHGQWPCWTDGEFVVTVTIWAGGGALGIFPEGVLEKGLSKKHAE